jgi:tetratricopeptide (TPR) repeat protein
MYTSPRDSVLILCGECRWCMVPASQSDQGTRWLERTIAAAPDPTDAIRAQALLALDAVRSQQQQLDLAQDLANDAMHMYKRLGDRVGEAHCLNGLGLAASDAGRSDEAEELLKATVAICEETRDAQAREVFLLNMGVVCLDRGNWARARDIFVENLSFAPSQPRRSGRCDVIGEPVGGAPDRRRARQSRCWPTRPTWPATWPSTIGTVSAPSSSPGPRPGRKASLWPSQLRRLPPSPGPASHPPPRPCWTRPPRW